MNRRLIAGYELAARKALFSHSLYECENIAENHQQSPVA
jgi:hypothetical protein